MKTSTFLPALLLILVMLALPVSGSMCYVDRGELLAPWAASAPPGEHRALLEEAQIVLVAADLPEQGTYFMGASVQSRTCYGNLCYKLPDLHATWYDANDTVIRIDPYDWEHGGSDIPTGADYGLLYFRTVPHPSTPVPYPVSVYLSICSDV